MSLPTDDELQAALENALGPVAHVIREPSVHASTADLQDVRVALVDGSLRHLVLKAGGGQSRREGWFYRHVLTDADLGTPSLIAAADGWVMLQAVAGVPLWQAAGVQAWRAAARLLARAHQRLATSAMDVGPAAGTSYADQFERAITREPRTAKLAREYAAAVRLVESAPSTVIHGEAFASNILLTDGGEPCLIDWETAGLGCGLTDLAALTAGWSPAARRQIAASYGGDLTTLPAARLLVAVRWLGEPAALADAAGGRAQHTDWWAEAQGWRT